MTTTVKVEAHCGTDTEVQVRVTGDNSVESITLQDGESAERHVYDDLQVTVKEVKKEKAGE